MGTRRRRPKEDLTSPASISILADQLDTGESPEALDDALKERLRKPFIEAGFSVEVRVVELRSGRLMIVVGN